MKKIILALSLLLCVSCVTGCTIATPLGTLNIGDIESFSFVGRDGEAKSIDLDDIANNVETFKDDLASNGDRTGIKKKIIDGLTESGINLDNIDFDSDESVAQLEQSLKEVLDKLGIDSSKVDTDKILDWLSEYRGTGSVTNKQNNDE